MAETEKLIDARALRRMRPSAYLLNAARGRVVDETALVDALARRQIRGAALDVTVEEPLPAASPLWAIEHVLITPHTAGETCRYEDNVLAIMRENLARLWRGNLDGGSQKEANKRVGTSRGNVRGFSPNPRRPVWSVPVRHHPQGAFTRIPARKNALAARAVPNQQMV